jgi:hypothetical protein
VPADHDRDVNFLKEDPDLLAVPLETAVAADVNPGTTGMAVAACGIAARLGGLLGMLAAKTEIGKEAVIAVWLVESGGRPFIPKRSAIRFEVHHFFNNWGKRNRQQFDLHFRFGGHNLQLGHPWENQEYRTEDAGEFHSVHHNQSSEYAALTLAQILADAEDALGCASIGGCQILMNSFASLGYQNAQEMYSAFQESERTQVLGFFDFCRNMPSPQPGDLLKYLRTRDWANFAQYYNGVGQVSVYSAKLESACDAAVAALQIEEAA